MLRRQWRQLLEQLFRFERRIRRTLLLQLRWLCPWDGRRLNLRSMKLTVDRTVIMPSIGEEYVRTRYSGHPTVAMSVLASSSATLLVAPRASE